MVLFQRDFQQDTAPARRFKWCSHPELITVITRTSHYRSQFSLTVINKYFGSDACRSPETAVISVVRLFMGYDLAAVGPGWYNKLTHKSLDFARRLCLTCEAMSQRPYICSPLPRQTFCFPHIADQLSRINLSYVSNSIRVYILFQFPVHLQYCSKSI